jgi:hypothetical protein
MKRLISNGVHAETWLATRCVLKKFNDADTVAMAQSALVALNGWTPPPEGWAATAGASVHPVSAGFDLFYLRVSRSGPPYGS